VLILEDTIILLSAELGRLIDDHNRCRSLRLKKLIEEDIQLLKNALLECEQPV
jgi:hypothetical protein